MLEYQEGSQLTFYFLVPGIVYGKVAGTIKNDKESGMGTLISVMLPYSMCFLVGWTIFLVIWFMTGLPIGIEGAIHLAGM